MIKAGDTFFLPDHNGVRHLYVVLSDPEQSSDQIFIAMISTRGDGKEECCILRAGDHPFLRHDSVVVYRMPPARPVSLAQLKLLEADGILSQNKNTVPVAPLLLERMRRSSAESRQLEDRVDQLLFRQGLVE